MIDIFCVTFGMVSLALALYCVIRLYRWERMLRRARIVIFFKGKSKINRPLIDWLRWCQSADKDKEQRGQAVYKMGGTTVAVLQPVSASHGKTVTKPVKKAA